MSRLRGGELTAAGGAAVVLVALFLTSFRMAGADRDGWSALGWLVLAVVGAAVLAAVALVVLTLRGTVAQAVGAGVVAATTSTFALVAVALRVLVFQPGPNATTTIAAGGWLAVAGAVLIWVGGWRSLADERIDGPQGAYVPPPARPAPPAVSGRGLDAPRR